MIVDSGAVPRYRPALRRCIATAPDLFAADYWDRAPLLSSAAMLPRDFSDLLSIADVDELLSRRGLRTPFIRMANEGRIVNSRDYTGPGGIGARVGDQVRDEQVLAQFSQGATVVLQGLHRLWPPLIEFSEQLVADLGHPVQINAYVTPPQSRGFADHYDTHDVFVLALAGRKRWQVRPPVVTRPAADDPWTGHADAVAAAALDAPLIDTVLEPGDALYLPRGFLHTASSDDEVCAHLTVGIHPITRRDIADLLLAEVRRDASLRTALPLRALDDADTMSTTVAAVSTALQARFADVTVASETAEIVASLARQLTVDARPEPVSPIAQSEAARALSPTDTVRLRRGLRVVVEKNSAHSATLDAGIARVEIDSGAELAIAGLSAGAAYRANSLPGQSEEESLALSAQLLRAGIIVLDLP